MPMNLSRFTPQIGLLNDSLLSLWEITFSEVE